MISDNLGLNLYIVPTTIIYYPSASDISNSIVNNNYLSFTPLKTFIEVVIFL